jgi:hypothetical protein
MATGAGARARPNATFLPAAGRQEGVKGHSEVAPATLSVDLLDHGVEVEYLDGRSVLYRGVPEAVTGPLRTRPGREVHVLVTDGTDGVLVYVEDRTTEDEILETTGVGRVLLSEGEETEVFPGVYAGRAGDYRVEVRADPAVADERVFVFAEDEWGEEGFEFVAEEETSDGAGEE